jgi:hypothetical protein
MVLSPSMDSFVCGWTAALSEGAVLIAVALSGNSAHLVPGVSLAGSNASHHLSQQDRFCRRTTNGK